MGGSEGEESVELCSSLTVALGSGHAPVRQLAHLYDGLDACSDHLLGRCHVK